MDSNSYYVRSRKEVVLELASRGLTQAEIITETGFPRGTVSSIMSKHKDEIHIPASYTYKQKVSNKVNDLKAALDILDSFIIDTDLENESNALDTAQEILLHRFETDLSDDELIVQAKKLKQIRDARRDIKQLKAIKHSVSTRISLGNIRKAKEKVAERTCVCGDEIYDNYLKGSAVKKPKRQMDIVNKFI